MAMMNSINGFPVSMNFAPIPGVTPMDASAFLTPQQKYLMSKQGGGQSASPATEAATGGAPQGGGGGGGLMEAITKLFMSGAMGMGG